MNVKVKLVSMPGHQPAGFDVQGNATLSLKTKATISDLLDELNLSKLESYMVLLNSQTVPPSEYGTRQLSEADEAAIFPPMEGG